MIKLTYKRENYTSFWSLQNFKRIVNNVFPFSTLTNKYKEEL